MLQSNIRGCGAPYTVSKESEDNVYKPGTLGLLSYVKGVDLDYPNVVYFFVVTVRRGKGGKQRLDFNEISFPIFNTPNLIDLSKKKEFMPPLDRRYFVMTETLPLVFSHALNMDGHDFLAWSCCHAKYLSQLRKTTNGFRMWPKDKKHVMNVMNSMDNYMNSQHFDEEQRQNTYNHYTDGEARDKFIRKMRHISSALTQCHVSYKQRVAKAELEAIMHINKNLKAFGADKKEAGDARIYHEKKYKKISQLINMQRANKNKSASKLF